MATQKHPDPIHRQRMRELLITLLKAYGVTADLDGLDNDALKAQLGKVF